MRLTDRFADHGLIAVALAEIARAAAVEIDTLLMSCRVLGRGVEVLILSELAQIAADAGCARIVGVYRPTGATTMVADLFARHGFSAEREGDDGETIWSADPSTLTDPAVPIRLARA